MRKNKNKPNLKVQVYEKLKLWDKKRAQLLRYHKKASEQIYESVQRKVEDSKDFLSSLQTILEQRVNQLKVYCSNSVVDSSLVFEKNKNQAYASHYELIKQIYNIQANNAKIACQKLEKLAEILNELKGCLQSQQQEEGSQNKKDESSLIIAKGDIKFLIQCELPQIVEKVVQVCENVSKVYNEDQQKDLYFSIHQFVRLTYKQTNKHRQIGKSLISYVSTSIKRQISIQNKIRHCLEKWSQVDGPIEIAFIQQLRKNNPEKSVKDFYNMEEMTDIGYDEPTVEEFLVNFKIEQFHQHERLKLCDLAATYNSKIEARVIVTADAFLHLVRLNAFQPDFTFKLNPELALKVNKQCNIDFIQYKKKFYFKKEKQFEFNLALSCEEDLHFIKSIIQKISQCKFQ